MEKEVAQALLSLAVSLDGPVGQMYAETRRFSDPAIKAKFDKAIGDLMGHVAKELIFPIVDRYPDLNPDK
ncbi:MAG: hypothetical protein WDN02_01845 [Methylovirgula sp.]|uniref:hypothetical protein n=1 Tax=Methylovirgula sp. TaxID=1978224 RepID=UPI0030761E6A